MTRASNLAGFSTSISPPRDLSVGVITAVSFVGSGANISGVVTATSFVGSGSQLTGLVAGVGIKTTGGTVGTGATFLDFRGSGISTITVGSGIATINVAGGGTGLNVINFILR